FYRRFGSYAQEFTIWKGLSAVVELGATVLVTFFLTRLLSLFGRRVWRVLATLVVLFSAGASYYMTFLNVVIGYGIIASVMTQQKLSFLLALYIGLFMNCAVFYRRFGSYAQEFTIWKGLSAVVELGATVLVTF
ncbi:phosphoethanolamine transferase domain-containing protein, partial [Aliarcobacter butzleri]|uniref:phosphoethanolamine transferase domain-containing protein n=1 Tax=Aliarcobacter butzleri TaxID=28197 RepID=UPI0019D58C66